MQAQDYDAPSSLSADMEAAHLLLMLNETVSVH